MEFSEKYALCLVNSGFFDGFMLGSNISRLIKDILPHNPVEIPVYFRPYFYVGKNIQAVWPKG
jgi:hypothetical protein